MGLAIRRLAEAVRGSGIPAHEVAGPLGLDARDVVTREQLNRLPVATLVLIAERVGLPLSALFSEPAANHSNTPSAEDVTILGACLGGNPGGVLRSVLAAVLGWDLDRVDRVIPELHQQMSPLGLTVVGGECIRMAPKPGVVERSQLVAVGRGPHGAVDPEVANVVWSAVFLQRRLNVRGNSILASAYKEGLLTMEDDGCYHVAEEVAISLMVGDATDE